MRPRPRRQGSLLAHLRVIEPGWVQGDQIGRFIALWASFQSLWQQLICPQFLGKFVKLSKSFIFLVKSFRATFIQSWQLFTGHTDAHILRVILYRLLKNRSRLFGCNQCDQIGKVWVTNVLTKVAETSSDFWANLKNVTILEKKPWPLFGQLL